MAAVAKRVDVAVFNELAAIDRLAAIHIERLLPGTLSAAQFGILTRLLTQGEQTPSQLADDLALTRPTMTHALARLETAGYVAVAQDEVDRRRKRLTITDEGRAAYAKGEAAISPMLNALRATFPAKDFETALPFLSRLRTWLQTGAA